MAIVSQKDNQVCACGSNRTWLLILATIEIITNAFFLAIIITGLCVEQKPESLDTPVLGDRYEEYLWILQRDVLVVLAIIVSLSLFAAFCPVLAEKTKRPGFLIPWYVLIILGLVYDIVLCVIVLIHGDFGAFIFVLFELTLDLFAIILTKRRYEELQQIAAALQNGHVAIVGSSANYGAAESGYKPLE